MAESSVCESCEYENKYYNICSVLQNLVSIAKVSAPLVFAEGKEYNIRCFEEVTPLLLIWRDIDAGSFKILWNSCEDVL